MSEWAGGNVALADLFAAMQQPACPCCRSSLDREERYFVFLLGGYATDGPTRSALERARGFCPQHVWRMIEVERDRLGGVTGSATLLELFLGAWERVTTPPDPHAGPFAACPACAVIDSGTTGELTALVGELARSDGPVRARFLASDGLCVPHLDTLLRLVPDSPGRRAVIERAQRQFAVIRAELREFDRKRAWRYRDEAPGTEQDAWKRAALLLGGADRRPAAGFRDASWPRDPGETG